MAKTYQDLVTEARELLQDTLSPYRYEDQFILNSLNRGLQDLGRIRPDAYYRFYRANSLNIPLITLSETPASDETAWTEVFGLDMMFYTPLMAYTVGSVELTDDEFTVDGRAMALLSQFRNTVLGV